MSSQQDLLPYPGLLHVNVQPGDFNSSLICLKSFKAGETIVRLTGTTKTTKTWSSVQHGPGPEDSVELNSVLVYANHSCSPNILADFSSSNKAEWSFRALRDIESGDDVSWFYPSSEWDMAQGFQCKCGSENCLGYINGAKYLTRSQLEERGFVNTHIARLMDERDNKQD